MAGRSSWTVADVLSTETHSLESFTAAESARTDVAGADGHCHGHGRCALGI